MVNSMIAQCSWFINVMPEIANLRANAARVTSLAQAIEDVQSPRDFYRSTGLSEFRYSCSTRSSACGQEPRTHAPG